MRQLWVGALLASSLVWPQGVLAPADQAWDLLKKGLQDSNPEKRKTAATVIGGMGVEPKAVQLLCDTMANDKDPEVRQAAASSLGEMKARTAIPKLRTAMENDPEVSFSAARALWVMGDRSGRDLVEEVATGQQKRSTGRISEAKLEASRRLHDPDGTAKLGAEEAANALLGPFSIGLKMVTELRKDTGAQGRLLAITMLTQPCDAGSVAAIQTAMENDKNEIVRAGAAKALGICGNRNAIPKLVNLLSSEKYPVQLAAAASIIRLSGRPASAPASLQKK